MKITNHLLLITGMNFFLLATTTVAQQNDPKKEEFHPKKILTEQFNVGQNLNKKKLNDDEFKKVAEEIIFYNHHVLGDLKRMLQDPRVSKKRKAYICAILERCVNSRNAGTLSKFLVENFTVEDSMATLSKQPIWGRYPAKDALISIGKQSLPQMIKVLEESDDELERKLARRVVFELLTLEDARDFPVIYLQRKIDKQNDSVKKERLIKAKNELEKPLHVVRPDPKEVVVTTRTSVTKNGMYKTETFHNGELVGVEVSSIKPKDEQEEEKKKE